MRPFFVADRPMSLRVLKGLDLTENQNIRIGIMAHANTSQNFQEYFRDYPCDNFDFCDAIGGPCKHKDNIEGCPARQRILARTIKMCDSGIFTKEGATLTYDELFSAYRRMGVQFGIMIDVFGNAEETIISARQGWEVYQQFRDDFEFVAVAQGQDLDEYLYCYSQLRNIGFEHIAIGGLLRKRDNTVRYVNVGDEDFMEKVLREVRIQFPNDWLFALGCFNPNRVDLFEELDVWADYKGWIFRYDKRDQVLSHNLPKFATNHIAHTQVLEAGELINQIQELTEKRKRRLQLQKKDNNTLYAHKRELRNLIKEIHHELRTVGHDMASYVEDLTTRGLLSSSETSTLINASNDIYGSESEQSEQIAILANATRTTKDGMERRARSIERLNKSLSELIMRLIEENPNIEPETRRLGTHIVATIERSEQDHRLAQIRENISDDVFALMVEQ